MEGVSCPKCRETSLSRYGKTAAGLQKYRCLNPGCRRQFVAGSDHLIEPEKKKIIMALLAQETPLQKIRAAVPGISLRWIYELRRRVRLFDIEPLEISGEGIDANDRLNG